MKRIIGFTLTFALLLGSGPALGLTKPAQADWGFHISFDFFYHRLRPYGHWRHVPHYGYVWSPVGVSRYWQPYSDGYWAYTEFGWTWVSYDEFGWVPYHYGSWTVLPTYGWVWVPGYVWAPAWVTWRYGPNYIGWAPLPPDYGFYYGRACPSVAVIDRSWVFVPSGSIGYSHLSDVRVPYQQYGEAISGTEPITNLTFDKDHVINPGPGGAPGGGGVGGDNGFRGDRNVGKFNLRQLKMSELGVKPQPVNDLRPSRQVAITTPYKDRALPEPVQGSSKGQIRDSYNPKAGVTPRTDRADDKRGSSGSIYDPSVGKSPRPDRDEKYNAPRGDVPQPRTTPRPDRDDKFSTPQPRQEPKNNSPRYEPQPRAEKPLSDPWYRSQPPPQRNQSPKVTDQPRPWNQPREQTQPSYKTPQPSRPDVYRSNPTPREKSSSRTPVYQDRSRSVEKTPRHVYQPTMKSPSARPSAPSTPAPRSGGSPKKSGKQ